MPKKMYLQGILPHYFILKKYAVEKPRILVETYSNHALSETTWVDWFRCCKNNDFDVKDKDLKKFEDEELETLVHKDSCQAQAELADSLGVDPTTVLKHLKVLGLIQK